jgi:hypothetical protein
MAANENSLLLRIRGDSSGGKAAVAETRAAVAQLRQSATSDLRQIQTVSTASLGSVTQSLARLTTGIPFVGNALNGLTAQFSTVTFASEGAATGLAGIAGPIGIAVVALGLMATAVVKLSQQLFALAHSAAEFQGKLFDLSQQTGVSVETLSALEVVARTTGSSIEGLTQSLGIFQRHLEEAQDENSKAATTFRKLGVDTLDTETALRQTVAALAQMPEGFRQTALALEVFGRGGKAFLAIAKESKGDIDEITRRLSGLGLVTTEQAKLADEFNDQLVILDVQLRGIGTQAIPVILDALKDLSQNLEENRDLFIALQGAVKGLTLGITIPLRVAIGIIKTEFDKALFVIQITVALFERMAKAVEIISGHPITLPSFAGQPVAPTTAPPKQAEPAKDPFIKQLEEQVAARKKLQGVLNFDFAQQQQRANASIAQAQREFEAGKRTRQSLLDVTIDGIRKQTNAEIEGLKVERRIKLEEQALAKDDLQKRTQLSNAILSIDTQIATKKSELREREKDERTKFQKEEINNEIAHQERLLAQSRDLDQVRITGIQQQVALRKKTALDGDREIENIELTAIDREQALLVKRLAIVGQDVAKQREIRDQIAALNTQRRATEQRHASERLLIVQQEGDITLQLIQVKGEALIAIVEALAERRVITEEEAQRRIAKVRLDALGAEIELTQARGQDTRVLEAQRVILQAETVRDIEAGQQEDVENTRKYASELSATEGRILRTQRDTDREVIDLMQLHFVSRKAIIDAQLKVDLANAAQRHKTLLESIRDDQRANDEQARILESRLRTLRAAGRETSVEYQKAIDDLAQVNAKKQSLHDEEEAELERSEKEKERILRQGRLAARSADPISRIGLNIDDLREFADVVDKSIVPTARILQEAFFGVADAIGQTVANWVLLGETGPAVMRKILAQALASIAAEAAVNAIKELALGFATLFFNPADSAAHFTSAALWASIGGVAAVAGRSVAGDLFKPKSTTSSGSEGRGTSGGLNPLNLARNAGPGTPQIAPQIQSIRLILEHRVDEGKFAKAITTTVVDDFNNAGPIREVIGGDGNLNRG